MNAFLDDINAAKNEQSNLNSEITNEILTYFHTKLESDGFTDYLKERIIKAIKDNKKSIYMQVEFWNYNSGCSATNFSIDRYEWKNPEHPTGWESHDYKGVYLYNISRPIVNKMKDMLVSKLSSLGLYCSCKSDECWLEYPRYKVEIFI